MNWKSHLGVLLFILAILWLICLKVFPPSTQPRKVTRVADAGDQYLQAWYAQFNDQLFYNQLPTNTVVRWTDLSEFDYLGETYYSSPTHDQFVIEVDPIYNNAPDTAKETLIHEMCHIEVDYVEGDDINSFNHGFKWEGCMERIAAHGGFKGIW